MNGKAKRIIAALILPIILLPLIGGLGLVGTAQAAELDEAERFPASDGWLIINELSDWDDILPGNKYYLTEDIEFDVVKYYPSTAPKDIVIDGNGHTVTLSAGQPSLFESVSGLTLRNIVLKGDLTFANNGGMNSPIARWNNSGKTVLENVVSRVNYTFENTTAMSQNASGVAVSATNGSYFKDVVYEGAIRVKKGARIVAAAGIVYSATNATLERCINRGKIFFEDYVEIGDNNSGTNYLRVGGITADATADTKFKDCVFEGEIEYNGFPYKYGAIERGWVALGGIVGYARGPVTIADCVSSGKITVRATKSASQNSYVGGILGYGRQRAEIEYCHNKSTIDIYEENFRTGGILGWANDTTLIGCTNSGDLTTNATVCPLGGMMGQSTGARTVFIRCSNSGDLTASTSDKNSEVGGLLGWGYHFGAARPHLEAYGCSNSGNILVKETAKGAYAGGLFAKLQGTAFITVKNCVNSGNVTLENKGGWLPAGGIIGAPMTVGLPWDKQIIGEYDISNCINTGRITGNQQVGGIIGANIQFLAPGSTFKISHCANRGEVVGGVYVGGILGSLNEGNVDSWNSDIGVTVYGCENSGTVRSSISSACVGGIIGNVYELKKTPEIILDSCINIGKIENMHGAHTGGLVGRSPFKLTLSYCVGAGELASGVHPFTRAAFEASDCAYLSSLYGAEIGGAIAVDPVGVGVLRDSLPIPVYDMGNVLELFDTLGKLDLTPYTLESRKAFRAEYIKVQNAIAFYEIEVLQSDVYTLYKQLEAIRALLVLKSDAPEGGGSADLPDSGAADRPVGGDTDIPADKDASDAPGAADKTDKSKNPAAEALADSVTELMSGLPSLQVLAIVLLVTVAVLALGVIALVTVTFLRS